MHGSILLISHTKITAQLLFKIVAGNVSLSPVVIRINYSLYGYTYFFRRDQLASKLPIRKFFACFV